MKYRIAKALFIVSFLVIVISLPMLAVHAAPAHVPLAQETPPAPLDDLMTTFKSLTGVAMLIAAGVNALKQFGVVKDGQSASWSAGLNMLALAALFAAQLFGYAHLLPSIDAQAGSLASVASVVIAYIYQLVASRKTHDIALAGLPVIGMSHSSRYAGETVNTLEVR